MPSDLSHREASGGRNMLPLHPDGKADRGAVTIGGGTYMATTDTGATASFISKERADNLAGWQTEDVAESMNSWRWKSLSGTSD